MAFRVKVLNPHTLSPKPEALNPELHGFSVHGEMCLRAALMICQGKLEPLKLAGPEVPEELQ